ncbi:MAG: Bax inhibitor-1/YccA family protein [Bacteroidota bacterium]
MARRNMFEKSNNPMFKEKDFQNYRNAGSQVLDGEISGYDVAGEVMTINGAVNKTFILGGVMLMAAIFAFMFPNPILMWTGFIGIPVVSFIAARNKERSHIWAPIFSIALGLMAGTASFVYGGVAGGVITQAVLITFSILFVMLTLYKTGTIKVTEKFRSIVSVAVGAIMLVYLVEFVLYMFGIDVPFLHESSPIGIGISLVIIGVASLNLLLDFDNFYKGEQMRAPEYMEWYFGMGLLFTLVWLYLEIIRLVAIFAGND